MREWLANGIVIGLSLAFLVHFSLIVKYGKLLIQEPNPIMLGFEIVMMAGFIAFAIFNMIKIVRRR